jgi:hypothetical protein
MMRTRLVSLKARKSSATWAALCSSRMDGWFVFMFFLNNT